tara:strand:- start:129 stop:350 length:222 start_codon:yes stop_codon:yes gene_type:complete
MKKMMKSKGMARGGKMKAKGMARGGKMKAKGMKRGGKTMKSKGMAKGGKAGGAMTLASIRSAAKSKGYKLVKA